MNIEVANPSKAGIENVDVALIVTEKENRLTLLRTHVESALNLYVWNKPISYAKNAFLDMK